MSRTNPYNACRRRNARNPRLPDQTPINSRRSYARKRAQVEHVKSVKQNHTLTNYEATIYQSACDAARRQHVRLPDWRDFKGLREVRHGR